MDRLAKVFGVSKESMYQCNHEELAQALKSLWIANSSGELGKMIKRTTEKLKKFTTPVLQNLANQFQATIFAQDDLEYTEAE
jgi:hypothetical protein